MTFIRESAGESLLGAIDGVNTVYTVSFPISDPIAVNVFVNGRLKQDDLDDGYTVTLPTTITLKEALIDGDTLEIQYQGDAGGGGGALGGIPGLSGAPLVPTITGSTI